MKRGKVKFLSLSTLFLGILLILYPTISACLTQANQDKVLDQMANTVSELSNEEKSREISRAKKYNENLIDNVVITDPYSSTDKLDSKSEYNQILQLSEDGFMASLTVPSVAIRLPIYHGTSDKVLNKGAGHLSMTSFPIGGPSTHTVISAHSGLVHAKMFDRLHEVQKGDIFFFNILDEVHYYKVIKIMTIEPNEFSKLQVVQNKDYATLLTCTPIGVNTHRLLVMGERTTKQNTKGKQLLERESNQVHFVLIMGVSLVICLIVIFFIYLYYKRKKNKKRKEKRRRKRHGHKKKYPI